MESKETRKLLFLRHNGSTSFSLFFDKKREGMAFKRLKFASSTTGTSEKQDVRHRAQKWNVGLERRKGLGTSRADV